MGTVVQIIVVWLSPNKSKGPRVSDLETPWCLRFYEQTSVRYTAHSRYGDGRDDRSGGIHFTCRLEVSAWPKLQVRLRQHYVSILTVT